MHLYRSCRVFQDCFMWAATKGAGKRILYNEQCLYIKAWLHREFWPFILCFIASSSCSFSYISLVFASLQQVKVGRYAGGNQVWSIKALTKWDRKMQADCRAKIIQNKRLHIDSKIQIKTNTTFFFLSFPLNQISDHLLKVSDKLQ